MLELGMERKEGMRLRGWGGRDDGEEEARFGN